MIPKPQTQDFRESLGVKESFSDNQNPRKLQVNTDFKHETSQQRVRRDFSFDHQAANSKKHSPQVLKEPETVKAAAPSKYKLELVSEFSYVPSDS